MSLHNPIASRQPSRSEPDSPSVLRIKHEPLFLLGLVLWELWYGQCLEEFLCDPNGSPGPDTAMDYLRWPNRKLLAAAFDAIDQMDKDAPTPYASAVRACLFGGIETDSQVFIETVWEKVVRPLEKLYEACWNAHPPHPR